MNGAELVSARSETSLAERVRGESFLVPKGASASRAHPGSRASCTSVNHRGTWRGLTETYGQSAAHTAREQSRAI
jgi:hypothetical protein